MTRTRPLLAVLLALAALAGLTACGSSDDATRQETAAAAKAKTLSLADTKAVTLRVGTQKDGIRAVLSRSGELAQAPYAVDFSIFQFGPPLVEAAGADKIDVAWVGSTPPIFGAAAHADFKVIAAVQEADHQENSVLVPQGSPIKTIQDLKGKKVAVAKGSSAHGMLLSALDRVGMKPSDVDIVFLAPADGLAAYSAHQVDAWVVWDPFSTQAKQEGSVSIAGGEPDERGTGFVIASAKALQDPAKRVAIDDYVNRLSGAWTWAKAHPQEWADAWAKDTGLPPKVTDEAVHAKMSTIVAVDPSIRARSQKLADLLTADQVLPGKVDFSSIIDTSVVQLKGAR
jgi:sulfonate transport system substrate-binding protein